MSTSTNSGGGPLHFEAIIDTDQYQSALKNLEKRILEFSTTGEKESQRVEKAMRGLSAAVWKIPEAVTESTKSLTNQRAIIRQIESDIARTEKAIGNLAPGRDRNNMQLELNAQKRALEEEKAALSDLEIQLQKTGGAQENYRGRIRNLLVEMANLEQSGQKNTDRFRELSEEAARLQDAIDDVTQRTRILANDQAGFQGVMSGVAGLSGAFAAGTGVMGLFNTRNEELMKIQTRVQSLMAITIGLQQVSNTLNKDSAFQVVVVEKAKVAWAKAQTYLNTQLGISIGLTKALMFGGIGILIAGVGLLVQKMAQWNKAQTTANEIKRQVADAVQQTVSALAKEKAELERLTMVLENSNASYHEKYAALKQLQQIVPQYTAELTKEGKLINSNTEALEQYMEALQRATYIKASQEGLEVLYRREYEAIKQLEDAEMAWEDGKKYQAQKSRLERALIDAQDNLKTIQEAIARARERFKVDLQQSNTELTLEMMDFDQLVSEWINRANNSALDEARSRLTTENALKQYIRSLEAIRGDLKIESLEYQKVVAEISALQKLDEVDLIPNLETPKLSITDQLREIRQQYELFYQWIEFIGEDTARNQFSELIQNGDNFLQYLNRQIAELEKKKNEQGLTEEESLRLIAFGTSRQELIGQKSELERFRNEIETKKEGYQSLSEYIIYLQEQIRLLSEIESEFSLAKSGLIIKELEDARAQQQNIFNTLVRDTISFEEKILEIREKYAQKRQLLNENADKFSDTEFQRRMNLIAEFESEEIASEQRISLEKSTLFKKLHEQVMGYSRKELRERMSAIKSLIAAEREKAEALDISTEYLKEFERAITDAQMELARMSGDSLYRIAAGLRSISYLAGSFNDELQHAVETMAELAEGTGEAIMGIALLASGNLQGIGPTISGLSQLVGTVVKLFKDDSLKRTLKEIEDFNFRLSMGEYDINMLYRERLRMQLRINEVSLEGIRRLSLELQNQSYDIEASYKKIFEQLMGEEYLSSLDKKKQKWYKRIFGDNYKLDEEWQSLSGQSYEQLEQLFLSGQLSDKAEELFKQLQKLKEEGLEIERQLEELRKKQQQLFTGTTADTIAKSIADGFASGKRSMADFAKDFENMMKQAIISGFSTRYIQPALEEFYSLFAQYASGEIGPDGRRRRQGQGGIPGMSQEQIEQLRARYGDIIDQLAEQFQLMQEIAGIDFGGANESLSGLIKGVTEETAGKLEGYINAMRIAQAQQIQIVTQQLAHLATISGHTANLLTIKNILLDIKTSNTNSLRGKGFA